MAGHLGRKVAVGIVCCWGFAFAALLFFYALSPWVDHREIPVFGSRSLDTVTVRHGRADLCVCDLTTYSGQTLGLVDNIRGEHTHTRISGFSFLFLAARSDRFRTFGEWVWAWHFYHSDDA